MLYHKEIGFPESLELKYEYTFNLKYSTHALEAAKKDRYGEIKLPQGISFPRRNIVEVESKDGVKVDKMVVRFPYALNNELDICMVIIPDKSLVKTVWFNKSTDKHPTLDKNKYEKVW